MIISLVARVLDAANKTLLILEVHNKSPILKTK